MRAPSARFFRLTPIAALLIFSSLFLTMSARAQTPVLVDREALVAKLQAFQAQLRAVAQQAALVRPKRDQILAAGQVQASLSQLGAQMTALERDIRTLAAAPGLAPLVTTQVITPPPPPNYTVVVGTDASPQRRGEGREWREGEHREWHEGDGERREGERNFRRAIDDSSFQSLIAAVTNESFSADKLRVLGDAAGSRFFFVDQVVQIIGLFSFPQDRVKALELVAPKIVDRQNNFKIYGAFTFENEKEQARRILSP